MTSLIGKRVLIEETGQVGIVKAIRSDGRISKIQVYTNNGPILIDVIDKTITVLKLLKFLWWILRAVI